MKNVFVLDAYDRKLLYELDKDSHTSISNLAKALRRSKQFVSFRLRRLQEEGVITNFTAIVDMSKLGFFTFRVYLKFQRMSSERMKDVIEYLKGMKEVWTIAICHGKWDLAFFVGIRKISDFHRIWDEILLLYKEYIRTYDVSLYAPVYNFNRTFFMNEEAKTITRVYGDGTKVKFDDLDWEIIKLYAPNVRLSSLEIARKLGVSPDTIRARIRKLEKKKILCGYKIGLNTEKLGYENYRIDLNLISTKRNEEILNYCKFHKNIYQVNKTIGGSDFEMELVVKDLHELLDIIDEIETKFSDVVNFVEYFSFSTYHLLTYIPD